MNTEQSAKFQQILFDLLIKPDKVVITSEVDDLLKLLSRVIRSNSHSSISVKKIQQDLLSVDQKKIDKAKWTIFSLVLALYYSKYPYSCQSGVPQFAEESAVNLQIPYSPSTSYAEAIFSGKTYEAFALTVDKSRLQVVSLAKSNLLGMHISAFQNITELLDGLDLKVLDLTDCYIGSLPVDKWQLLHKSSFKLNLCYVLTVYSMKAAKKYSKCFCK